MELGQGILADLAVIFVAARLGGWILARLGQAPVLGELAAGVLIGPHALGLVGRPSEALVRALGSEEAAAAALSGAYHTVAELGLILLLFCVGLETRVGEIFKVGRRALAVGALGVTAPFLLGYGFMRAVGHADVESLFVGAALVATSTGITARLLRDLGVIRSTEARIILGAAVIDDVLSLSILAVLGGLGEAERSASADIVLLILESAAFIGFVTLVGTGVIRRYGPHLRRTAQGNTPFVLAVAICLGLAVLAGRVGLSPIVGAFLAGMLLAEARAHFDLERAALPVYELMVPFFFAVAGMEVDLAAFADLSIAGLTAALTVLAIVGKLIGCALGAWGLGWRSMAIIGVGMVPRGEVGLVAVSIGRALNAVPAEIFSVIVALSFITTVIVPPVLRRLTGGPPLTQPATATPRDMDQQGRLPNLGVGQRAA